MVRLVIADNNAIFIHGIKILIEKEVSFKIVGVATSSSELLLMAKKTKMDVVVINTLLPSLNGIETTKAILQKYSSLKVLVMVDQSTMKYLRQILLAGAHGIILMNTDEEELSKGVKAIIAGKNYYSPSILNAIIEIARSKEQLNRLNHGISPLEKQILQCMSKDMLTREIAAELNHSVHSIEAHRKGLLRKFNVRTSAGLISMVVNLGIISSNLGLIE